MTFVKHKLSTKKKKNKGVNEAKKNKQKTIIQKENVSSEQEDTAD